MTHGRVRLDKATEYVTQGRSGDYRGAARPRSLLQEPFDETPVDRVDCMALMPPRIPAEAPNHAQISSCRQARVSGLFQSAGDGVHLGAMPDRGKDR
jgi:hypothetical protein